MRAGGWMAVTAAVAMAAPAMAALVERKPPYYGSIAPGRARMRAGPGRNYPAVWLYVRAGLPVKVLENFKEKGGGALWYKVEDPGGTQGWMQSILISERRTAMVMGETADLREQPRFDAKVGWRAEPGVIGRIGKCARGWCYLDVSGRGGFVEISHLWGVDATETID